MRLSIPGAVVIVAAIVVLGAVASILRGNDTLIRFDSSTVHFGLESKR